MRLRIIDNFDLAAVRGYFLGGSLSEWLREHGGTVYADRLDKLRTLDPQDPQLNDRLAEVFGVSARAVTEVFCRNAPGNGACAGNNGGSRCGSFREFLGRLPGWLRKLQFRKLRRFSRFWLGNRFRRTYRAWKLQIQPLGMGVGMALRWAWVVPGLVWFVWFVRFVWLVSVRFWELSSRLFRELSVGELFRLVWRGNALEGSAPAGFITAARVRPYNVRVPEKMPAGLLWIRYTHSLT